MRALRVTVFDDASASGALHHQRQMMLRALRADLADLPGVTLVVVGAAAAAKAGAQPDSAIRIGPGAAGAIHARTSLQGLTRGATRRHLRGDSGADAEAEADADGKQPAAAANGAGDDSAEDTGDDAADDAADDSGIGADKPAATDARLAAAVDAAIHAADAVWPMASEAGGLLERVSQQVLNSGRILLGSRPQALRVAGSRLRTARALAQAGIPVAAIYAVHQELPRATGAWLVRPDDGDGCADTRIYASAAGARAWILAQHAALHGPPPHPSASGASGAAAASPSASASASASARLAGPDRRPAPPAVDYVLQPFIPGKAGSLSLLCCDGRAQLLSCNEHRIAVRDNQFHLLGTTVNSMADSDGAFARLAQAVAAAVPGLWGHVGVEFVIGVRGVVVLEINARITPAYAGLRASLGCNPAALVMDLLDQRDFPARVRLAAAARPAAVAVSVDLGIDLGLDPGIESGIDPGADPDLRRGGHPR